MFWGLQLEANLRYSQQVPEGFRITKATLSTETPPGPARSQDAASKLVQVFVDQEGSDYAIATLKHGEIYDCSMDLRFAEGEDICFYLKGEGVVFLTGHNLNPDNHDLDGFLHGASSSGEEFDTEGSEGDSSDDDGITDITEAESKGKRDSTKAINGDLATKKIPSVKAREEEDEESGSSNAGESADESADEEEDLDEDDDADEEDDDEDEEDAESEDQDDDVKPVPGLKRSDVHAQLKSKLPDPKKAKLQNGAPSSKRANGDVKRASEAGVKTSQSAGKSAAANLTNESVKELIIEDITQGSGPVAKKGRTVKVYYSGKLLNGKQFDATKSGKPFEFKLGTQSVIQGWDKGLEGMRVGGRRRLVIPANLAYGKRRMGPIPPGSALKFDIELKGVA